VRDVIGILREVIPDAQIQERSGDAELVLGNPRSYSDALFTDTFGVPLRDDVRSGVAAQVVEARAWPGTVSTGARDDPPRRQGRTVVSRWTMLASARLASACSLR
jgi:hypothetical protein